MLLTAEVIVSEIGRSLKNRALVLTEGFIMTAGTIKIEGRKFRVIPEEDYQVMRNALRQQQRQAAEDRTDVLDAVRRLADPKEKRIPWNQVKQRAGLA